MPRRSNRSTHNKATPSPEATAYLINHIVLPPRLPQTDDNTTTYDKCLLDAVLDTLQELQQSVSHEHVEAVTLATDTIKHLARCHLEDDMELRNQLNIHLAKLADDESLGTCVPIEVKAQNAGLLLTRRDGHITFESFELTATNNAIMGQGRLSREFPGFATRIPYQLMQEKELRTTIASTLTDLTKNHAQDFETLSTRKSCDPALVTDLLMNIVAALGETTDVSHIVKHTRDDILSEHGAKPWRRSPLWLLIRVTLHLLFSRKLDNGKPLTHLYKLFVVLLISRVLDWVRKIQVTCKIFANANSFRHARTGSILAVSCFKS